MTAIQFGEIYKVNYTPNKPVSALTGDELDVIQDQARKLARTKEGVPEGEPFHLFGPMAYVRNDFFMLVTGDEDIQKLEKQIDKHRADPLVAIQAEELKATSPNMRRNWEADSIEWDWQVIQGRLMRKDYAQELKDAEAKGNVLNVEL